MRVAMVSEHASPLAVLRGLGTADAGGQNVHVAALAQALARRGHAVEVYTRRDDPALPERVVLDDGVEVVHVPAGPAEQLPKDELLPFMPAFGDWMADRWAATSAPDILHAHFWMSGVACLRARERVPVPFAQTFHALGVVKRRYQGAQDTSPPERLDLETRLAKSADAVIATATDEVRELLELGAPAETMHVVPCGVDPELFAVGAGGTAGVGGTAEAPGATAADGTLRGDGAEWWRGRGGRVLSLSRLVERKGVGTIVAALARLPEAELVVAGGPTDAAFDDDPEVRRLRAEAERHGVADRVRLIGAVPREDVPRLMRSADVVVCTPWYEPFGIVPLEAMACGRPLVGSAVGGLLDTIVDGVTGVHVPPRDPERLAAVLAELLADPDRRTALGRAGARRVAERYTWPRVAEDTERVYQRLAAAVGAGGRR